MDFWEFLVRSEWPVVVAGGLFVFREPIKQKLESTVKASGLGVSLEFAAEKLASVRQAQDDLKKEVQTLKEDAAKVDNPHLAATAAKIEAALEKSAAANNAVSSTLSEIRVFREHLQDGIKVR
jgi:hypothetical protein